MSWSSVIGHGIAHGTLGEGLKPLFTGLGYATNSLAPIEAPRPELAMDLARKGWITEDNMRAVCLMNGIKLDLNAPVGDPVNNPSDALNAAWKAVYYAGQELPTQAELLEIANRQLWDDGKLNKRLIQYGYYQDSVRQPVVNLRYDIPGPSDLVRFSVRHVWEPDLLANIGYDREFPGAIIDVWHAMKGLDYPLFSSPQFVQQIDQLGGPGYHQQLLNAYSDAGVSEPTWAKAYWWAHWILPSPSQGYEMMFRLRPDRDKAFDPPEALGQNFTFEDLSLLLRANDYPPKYRPLLAAIAYRIPGVRFIRDFVKQGVYNYANVVEWAKRWGYSPRDATDIADDVWRNVQASNQAKTTCKGCEVAEEAYNLGILGDQDFQKTLSDFGLPPSEVPRILELTRLKQQVKVAREVIASVRKRYLKGVIDAGGARNLLNQLGLTPAGVALWLDTWQLELESRGKELSAAAAVRYFCKGFLDELDLRTRLSNLGYENDAVDLLTQDAKSCQSAALAAAVAKANAAVHKAEAQAYTQARRARQQLIEAQQALAKHGSPAQLRKWFCEGSVGEAEVYARLQYLGWPNVDITRLIGDCKAKSG